MLVKKMFLNDNGDINISTAYVNNIKNKHGIIRGLSHGTPYTKDNPQCLKRHIEVEYLDESGSSCLKGKLSFEGQFKLYTLMKSDNTPYKLMDDNSNCYELKRVSADRLSDEKQKEVLLCVAPLVGIDGKAGEITINKINTKVIYNTKELVDNVTVEAPMLILSEGLNFYITLCDRVHYFKNKGGEIYIATEFK